MKTKIFFGAFAVIVAGSVAISYHKFMVVRDYVIEAQVDCNPSVDRCFVWKCDPTSTKEDTMCTGNPEEDTWYYKLFRRNAKNIPLCDPSAEDCAAYVCPEGERDCEETFCDELSLAASGELDGSCSDPEQYNLENPDEPTVSSDEMDSASGNDEGVASETEEDVVGPPEEQLE